MKKNPVLFNKTLVIGIFILLIGMSAVSSTDNILQDNPVDCHILDSIFSSEEILSREEIAYGYIAYSGSSGHPEGPCYFDLDDPGNITSLAPTQSTYFLTGGTWTCDDRWFGSEYNTGILWEIDPETGDMWSIGGGGTDCSLSYNPVNEKFYSVCGSIINSEGELICDLSDESIYLIDIAFDGCGILYGWDSDNLWIIDIETCEATLIGPLGIDNGYGGYGHFDFDTDILYISTYYPQGNLYECDEDTGECTLVGNFEGGAEITALAIPYNCSNHPPDPAHNPIPHDGADEVPGDAILSWNGSDPDSCDTLTYDVFFSISYPPVLASGNQTETCFDPYGELDMPIFEEYYWKIVTWDNHGASTSSPIWSFKTGINCTPPPAPTIDGPTQGKIRIKYEYTFNSTLDSVVRYYVNWGDGSPIEIINATSPHSNQVKANHSWNKKAMYNISARTSDFFYGYSDWGYLEVTILRNRATTYSLLQLLFERFPLLEVFIRAANLLR